uniref:Uncharacterized protein n=1 Tax=Stomoxys calcitrans TaxID=35570 RepID=A0A1I8PC47_STOCA
MAQRSLKSWPHQSPHHNRRLQLYKAMNLPVLMFLGCCSCLMLWPQTTMATFDSTMQDFGSVTAKGENIFMLAAAASANNGDDLGNGFPGEILADADDNDFGQATGLDTAADGAEIGKATNVAAKMPIGRKEEPRPNAEDLEMMQQPEHYKKRIMGQQQQQLDSQDLKPASQHENNRHLRYQQIQQALREPITPVPPHRQERHHHNPHQHQQQHRHENAKQQEEYKWPLHQRSRHHSLAHQQMAHLHSHRHHHHPHQHREHLHHQRRHNLSATATTSTTTTTTTTLRPRYFDRDGLYSNPLAWIPSTEGPLESAEENKSPGSIKKHLFNPHNHLFNDEDMLELSEDDHEARKKEEEFKRISLSLDATKDSGAGNDNKLFDALHFNDNDGDEDDDTADGDDDDDYSYDDDNNNNKNGDLNRNRHPPTGQAVNTGKINVKRYTNPQRAPYKASLPSSPLSSSSSTSASRRRQQLSSAQSLYGPSPGNDDNEDYDSNDENTANGNSANDDADDNFSDEKWNKIEHEHYRKQLQHQKAMQALRSRRPTSTMDNNSPNSIISNKNSNPKYPASAKSASTAKRPIINEVS